MLDTERFHLTSRRQEPAAILVVVYHVHGQTIRFIVWVNGSQSSALGNFVPESPLLFVQISSIYRKTAAKAWNWYQRWLWRNGTRISVWNIPSEKTGLPFQMFRYFRKFSVGKTQKVAFHSLSNRISQKSFVNDKQPVFQNNEMAAMLVFHTNLLGVVLFSYVNALFCPIKLA